MGNTEKKTSAAFKVNGNWTNQSRDLKRRFSELTDKDLKIEEGKENEMLTRVENRLNKNREEVLELIKKNEPNTMKY